MKTCIAAVTALGLLSVLILANPAGSALPAGTPAKSAGPSAAPASGPAYPAWDGKESIADYARRAGIEANVTLTLDGNVTMEFALVPAGKFLMGSPAGEPNRWPDEGPQREVTFRRPFYVGIHEVAQAQYKAVMGDNPSRGVGPARPVEQVNWQHATDFCKALAKKTGKACRLPTEAEWEYACRAGSKAAFCYGDDPNLLGDYAWFAANSDGKTRPVGQKKPNAWGLYDMHGNDWEWCQDWYGEKCYEGAAGTDPAGPAAGTRRVLRGGSLEDAPAFCRCAYRNNLSPDVQLYGYGFRVVMEVGPVHKP